jgi:hypothetical protein
MQPPPMSNPYTSRPVTAPDYFVAAHGGRGAQAHRLIRHLQRQDPWPDSLSIVGERRFGKTSLLGYLQRAVTGTPNLFVTAVDMLTLPQQSPEGFYAMLTRALQRAGVLSAGHRPLGYLDFVEILHDLRSAGRRLVVFLDEFDVVARARRFNLEFFDNLRGAASVLPLTLVVASVAPLVEIAHAGVYGSPFFNIFNQERLGQLSPREAEALIHHPPGSQAGVGEAATEILAAAGRHPFFLQRACACAWDLRAAAGGRLDRDALRSAFAAAVQDHWQYTWDHSSSDERQAFCALVKGTRSAGKGVSALIARGYVSEGDHPEICGEGLAEFVRSRCAAACPEVLEPAKREPTTSSGLLKPVPRNTAPLMRRLALVLGVNRYRYQRVGDYYLPPLRYAERDAEEIAALLTILGFEVQRLLGPQATVTAVGEALTAMQHASAANPHPGSCFVFHFSGHGQMDPHDDETAYLVLHDTDPANPVTTGLEMSRLVYQHLARVQVSNTLVLLDACHAGFAAGIKDMVPVSCLANVAQQLFTGLRGRLVLAACAGEAQAREKEGLGHGVFTYYVLRHWRDLDGYHPPDQITFGSLIDYVGQNMPRDHPELPLPVYNGIGMGGTVILRRIDSALGVMGRRPASGLIASHGARSHGSDEQGPSTEGECLLHRMWDSLDANLQDAFSLAYNKKRREGASRISTRDFFQALVRIQDDSLQLLLNSLPRGALPQPVDASVTVSRQVLEETPLLSDCVADSLNHFRQLQALPRRISPADIFVDVAKHGHGPSVARLRKHGVGPSEIEAEVQRLGLPVIRRK